VGYVWRVCEADVAPFNRAGRKALLRHTMRGASLYPMSRCLSSSRSMGWKGALGQTGKGCKGSIPTHLVASSSQNRAVYHSRKIRCHNHGIGVLMGLNEDCACYEHSEHPRCYHNRVEARTFGGSSLSQCGMGPLYLASVHGVILHLHVNGRPHHARGCIHHDGRPRGRHASVCGAF